MAKKKQIPVINLFDRPQEVVTAIKSRAKTMRWVIEKDRSQQMLSKATLYAELVKQLETPELTGWARVQDACRLLVQEWWMLEGWPKYKTNKATVIWTTPLATFEFSVEETEKGLQVVAVDKKKDEICIKEQKS